jgi:hypothetical protein
MDKLQLTGQNLVRVFNSRSGCMCAMYFCCFEAKWPSLKLKTWPKQLLGFLPLAFALSAPSLALEKTNTPSYFVAASVTKKKVL